MGSIYNKLALILVKKINCRRPSTSLSSELKQTRLAGAPFTDMV